MAKIIEIKPEFKQRITNSTKLVESWIPKLPSIYQIEVMSRCDFSCNFCQTGLNGGAYLGSPTIDPALFSTIIERDLGGSSFIELQFRGEPTLNKRLVDYVLALRRKVFVGFSTHGNLLHKDPALHAALNSHYITISVDAAEKELYENYRIGGSWERLILNIALLVHEKGKSKYPIIDLQLIEFENFEEQVVKLTQIAREQRWLEHVNIRTIKDTQATLTVPNELKNELCTNPWYSVSIKANGDVVPCCMAFEDEAAMVYGNLHEDSLETIWNSSKVKDFRSYHRFNENLPRTCVNCYARSPHNFHQNLLNDILKKTL